MKVALYGKGILGEKVFRYLVSAEGIEVICICNDTLASEETAMVFADTIYDAGQVPIMDFAGLCDICNRGEADAVILATENGFLDFVVKRMVRHGLRNIAVIPSYYEEDYEIEDGSFIWVETDKPRMSYIEYHISFHCNLKCAGCTHFSNIIDEERFGDYEKFCNDLIRLQEFFWGISKIRLMGGEPLLNPELPKFIYAARSAFPDADIRVVSNGLMLRDHHTEILEAMRNTATFFDVSMYPPTRGSINNIYKICKDNGVKLTVTSDVEEFMARMNLQGDSDIAEAYKACPSSHCNYLYDGHISTCVMPQVIEIFNKKYGLDIQPGEQDVIDIYEDGLDGYKLMERLKSPMDICRYCDVQSRFYQWFVSSDPLPDEWSSKI
ncbi:MAG: radical SAM protein [Lachnospiraceae bacterium]|nr:radical SAM protein [Lachnospiraceae bacterium]